MMFPMTITLNTADQLTAVMSALGLTANCGSQAACDSKPAKPAESAPAKKQETKAASTEAAATQTTAEAPAAQEPKAEPSAEKPVAMTADERSAKVKAAIASAGRDAVVALLAKYDAKKASEVDAAKLPAFDEELCKLAA